MPDPAKQNKNLQLYTDAIGKVAEKRGCHFVDLFRLTGELRGNALTDNGMHLTGYGYWKTAPLLEQAFGWKSDRQLLEVGRGGKLTAGSLPALLSPRGDVLPGREYALRAAGLGPGKYVLKVDGKPVRTALAAEWQAGVVLKEGPDFDQAEKLRRTIVEKNRLYFHRWRPQNETYLFGFRQHEQGQNAREVPLFDPLVEAKEKEIAKLRRPASHLYQLERLPDRPEKK